MDEEIELRINRGSDLNFTMEWETDGGNPIPLTGATVRVFEPHPALAGAVSLTVADEAGGVIAGRVNWRSGMMTGRHMTFRVQISVGEDDISTRLIWVVVV